MRRILAVLILALAAQGLLGCKADKTSHASSQFDENASPTEGNAQGGAPTPGQTPVTRTDARPVIVCFGDSLTEGYGADAGQSYPDFLQTDLDRAGYQYRVINEGVSGNTSKDGVDRLEDVIAEHPQIVVLEFGGNDGLRGIKTQITRANLSTMIASLQKNGIQVVLAGIILPPDYGPDYVKSFVSNYTDLAKKYNVPLLPFLLKDVYGVKGMMQADNIHATDQGNRIVANNVLPVLEPLLKK